MSGILCAHIGAEHIVRINLTVSSGAVDYNMRNAAIAAGWDQLTPLDLTVTINSGVQIAGSSTASPAFDTGSSFPAGSTLALINSGGIVGRGGDGGDGSGGGIDGKPGGPALRAQYPLIVTNNGHISGGGGGGGCSIHDNYGDIYQRQAAGGNGGSSNFNWSSGGSGTWDGTSGGNAFSGAWSNNSNAQITTDSRSIFGGEGGTWGSNGSAASGGNAYNGNGGAGGNAVLGNSFITWLATGTRRGPIA